MPQTYKGAAIPAYSDTADGPLALRNLVDAGNVVSRVSSGQKPAAPQEGHLIWNTTDKRYEYWNGTAWVNLSQGTAGPRGFLGESYVTNVSGTNQASTYATGTTVTVSGVTGRRLKVSTWCEMRSTTSAVSDPDFRIRIRQGSTEVASVGFKETGTVTPALGGSCFGTFSASTASTTFTLDFSRGSSNFTPLLSRGYLLVEDIGAA